jgi:hypothetical protein
MQGTAACQHDDWAARAQVIRLTGEEGGPVVGWTIDLEVTCVLCLTPMTWIGLPGGSSPTYPTVSANAQELRLPSGARNPGPSRSLSAR